MEHYKPQAGRQGAGCVLEVEEGHSRHVFPAGNLRMDCVGEKQRDTLLLPVESQETDCTHPYKVFKGNDRKKI